MQSIAREAVGSFNLFITEQLAQPGDAKLTLVLFNTVNIVPFDHFSLREVPMLSLEAYSPTGSTALLDAIGETIDSIGNRLAHLKEEDRPGKVIVAILTDGEENSSVKWSEEHIAQKIRHQTEVYKWSFLFLGANQDAIATASNLNINAVNAASFSADSAGLQATVKSIGRKANALRAEASGHLPSSPVRDDLSKPLSDIVDQEEKLHRGV